MRTPCANGSGGSATLSDAPVRLVLLDRDGTVNHLVRDGYVTAIDELRLFDGAAEAVRDLTSASVRVALVTNQSCIGRGLVPSATVAAIHAELIARLHAGGGLVQGVYCCPHAPGDACTCRKPAPGLLLRAAGEAGCAAAETVMIGDSAADMEAARRAGMRGLLVLTGRGAEECDVARADACFASLPQAVEWILGLGDRGTRGRE